MDKGRSACAGGGGKQSGEAGRQVRDRGRPTAKPPARHCPDVSRAARCSRGRARGLAGEVIVLSSDDEVEGSADDGTEGSKVIALSSDEEVKGGEDGGTEGGEVIVLSSDDEVQGGSDGGTEGVEVGPEYKEIDIDEWRSAFPTTSMIVLARTSTQ